MMNPTLENKRVLLTPLDLDNFEYLAPFSKEKGLIKYSPSDIETSGALEEYTRIAIRLKDQKKAIPLIIFDKQLKAYAGSTRFMNIDWKHRNLEIGSTWIGKKFQGTGLNTAMKELMLAHAFRHMNFERVSFRIDERNLRSRRAVEKLGAVLEGILRRDIYLLDGFKRNTCIYSILKEEWVA